LLLYGKSQRHRRHSTGRRRNETASVEDENQEKNWDLTVGFIKELLKKNKDNVKKVLDIFDEEGEFSVGLRDFMNIGQRTT